MTVHLRPTAPSDLPQLNGADSPLDNFGPRAPKTTPPPAGLDDAGGMSVVDDNGLVLGDVSWVYLQWGPNLQSRSPVIGIWLAAPPIAVGDMGRRRNDNWLTCSSGTHWSTGYRQAQIPKTSPSSGRSRRPVSNVRPVIRGCQWRDGAYRDSLLYAVLRADWAANLGAPAST